LEQDTVTRQHYRQLLHILLQDRPTTNLEQHLGSSKEFRRLLEIFLEFDKQLWKRAIPFEPQ
jgi:hypothetical protein